MGDFGSFWELLGASGSFWQLLGGSWVLLGGSGRFWEPLRPSGLIRAGAGGGVWCGVVWGAGVRVSGLGCSISKRSIAAGAASRILPIAWATAVAHGVPGGGPHHQLAHSLVPSVRPLSLHVCSLSRVGMLLLEKKGAGWNVGCLAHERVESRRSRHPFF